MDQVNNKFRPSAGKALLFIAVPLLFVTSSVLFLFYFDNLVGYILGQVTLSIFLFQCFILLHECGHQSYFKSKILNKVIGFLMGFISLIPFKSWVEIHNLHHKWTGFRDKDPTTEGTVSPKYNLLLRSVVNVSWFFFIPLFTVAYRFGNYWGIKKLKKHVRSNKLVNIYLNIIIQLMMYVTICWFAWDFILVYIIPAYVLSLMISDLFILSQHSHIEIPVAGNNVVKPIKYLDQVKYTRSILFGKSMSKLMFLNFNLHEAHHAYPSVPAYHLDKVVVNDSNAINFFEYLKKVKRMSGMKFIFNTSKDKI